MQHSILWLFLILAGASIIVFTYAYLSSKKANQSDQGMNQPLKKRFWFLLILFVILGIFASVTIPKSPYYLFADETPARVLHVAAMQYAFILSNDAINPESPQGETDLVLPLNELIEFRVTSLDVNHGFAIYDANNQLIAQTQAMPGYVNRLRWKFTSPGKYNILCLEFCGMAHQGMRSSFTVKKKKNGISKNKKNYFLMDSYRTCLIYSSHHLGYLDAAQSRYHNTTITRDFLW